MTVTALTYAVIGGVIPTILWLWFWLREDSENPEPKTWILRTFLLGAAVVIPAAIIENIFDFLQYFSVPLMLLAWAIIEEFAKLGAVVFLKKKGAPIDEPIDWMIYMLTAALGFAALENTIFLLPSFQNELILEGIMIGNLRFIGATLLHVLASGIHGATLGLSFYLSGRVKKRYRLFGIFLAITVHLLFNVALIISEGSSGSFIFFIFSSVWIALAALIMVFEKVKQISPKDMYNIR